MTRRGSHHLVLKRRKFSAGLRADVPGVVAAIRLVKIRQGHLDQVPAGAGELGELPPVRGRERAGRHVAEEDGGLLPEQVA